MLVARMSVAWRQVEAFVSFWWLFRFFVVIFLGRAMRLEAVSDRFGMASVFFLSWFRRSQNSGSAVGWSIAIAASDMRSQTLITESDSAKSSHMTLIERGCSGDALPVSVSLSSCLR